MDGFGSHIKMKSDLKCGVDTKDATLESLVNFHALANIIF